MVVDRRRCLVVAVLLASADAVRPAVATRPPAVRTAAPVMIMDQLKKIADDGALAVKQAAAEKVVGERVAAKLAAAQAKYDIPQKYTNLMQSFFTSYMTEIYLADRDLDEYEQILSTLMKKVLETAQEPHTFQPFHEAIRAPFDYYKMGCDFANGMVDADRSLVLGAEQIEKMQQQIAAGDNVVLFANHQSEADPQIFSVLLDPKVPGFAEETIFVAGDRVTTDLLAMPFSMGRNLLCIFSKKHVDNPPELKSTKQRHNRMVMKTMQQLMTDGGKCIWVAPSGGRDRPSDDGKYEVAPFDSKSIEMFRLMSAKADGTATSGQPRGNLGATSSHLEPSRVICARRTGRRTSTPSPCSPTRSARRQPPSAGRLASSGQSSTTRRRSTLARRWTCRASRRGA